MTFFKAYPLGDRNRKLIFPPPSQDSRLETLLISVAKSMELRTTSTITRIRMLTFPSQLCSLASRLPPRTSHPSCRGHMGLSCAEPPLMSPHCWQSWTLSWQGYLKPRHQWLLEEVPATSMRVRLSLHRFLLLPCLPLFFLGKVIMCLYRG